MKSFNDMGNGISVPVLTGDGPAEDMGEAVAIDEDGAHPQVGWGIISCLVCDETGRLPVFATEDIDTVHTGICSAACGFRAAFAGYRASVDKPEGWEEISNFGREVAMEWGLDDFPAFLKAAKEYGAKSGIDVQIDFDPEGE